MLKRVLVFAVVSCLWSCGGSKTTGSIEPPPASECGNNVRRDAEQCDGTDIAGESCTSVGYDGGTLGCSTDCTFDTAACTGTGPVCPNNIAEGLEECDGTDLNGATCRTLGYDGGTLICSGSCAYDTTGCTGTAPVCGNGNAEGLEECDGVDLRQLDCTGMGFNGGVLSCDGSCHFVTSACTGTAPVCGDQTAQGLEQCDGPDLNNVSCIRLGYDSGQLGCKPDCLFDTSACVGTPAVCGDNAINGLEQCDGTDLGNQACTDLGYTGGTLACDNSCTYDARACTQPVCPNDVREPGEDCDGTDLGNTTCVDLGLGAGTLTCTATCRFDTAGCSTPSCGDNAVNQAAEQCDGTDLGGASCQSLSFQNGRLLCAADCTFNTLMCFGSTATCNDGVKALSEECDGTDFGTATCTTEGYTGGNLTCTNCRIDTSTCTGTGPVCPNNVAEGAELCDGTDLRNMTCADFGFTGGILACNQNCVYVFAGCTMTPPCGNNIAEWPEFCDGTDLRGQSCQSLNAGTGNLACLSSCDGFDFAGCSAPPVCGNNQIDGFELCDGTDLGRATSCATFGYGDTTSAIGCLPTCSGYDLSQCTNAPNRCGNGRAQGMEQCDGNDLRNQTCESLGYTSGNLTCRANCSLDVTACVL